MTDRVSIFDLRLAADWCQSYEPAGDDEDQADVSAIHRVAAWLKAEAEHREQESLIRDTMKRHKLKWAIYRVRALHLPRAETAQSTESSRPGTKGSAACSPLSYCIRPGSALELGYHLSAHEHKGNLLLPLLGH